MNDGKARSPRNGIATQQHLNHSGATAPYNFVQLNNQVIPGVQPPPGNQYHQDRNSGYISYNLENLTPLFIGSGTDKPEKDKCKTFFKPGNQYKVPGSSVRGMIRTLVEIMSWGKFEFCDTKRKLYFRAVGDGSSLGILYRELMLDEGDYCYPKIKAGVLRKRNANEYYINPSPNFYRINFKLENRTIDGTNLALKEFDFKRIYFIPVLPANHTHRRYKPRTGKMEPFQLKYAKVTEISEEPKEGYQEGYLISSGNFSTKKHMHWIIDLPSEEQIPIDDQIIQDYRNDISRDEHSDLFRKLSKEPNGVPCFYLTDDDGKIISFGFTGMFRLAYTQAIGSHIIPQQLKDMKEIDIATSIFGTSSSFDTFASRVFFEEALLCNEAEFENQWTMVLSSPKPTCFPHYLCQQKEASIKTKTLRHWNDKEADIRGYKLYWHRYPKKEQLEAKELKETKDVEQTIRPMKPGAKFVGKIRFENLTDIELGALLFALDLPKKCYHKLGMGKPYGLGSVKITPELWISDRKSRYQKLFNEGQSWHLAETKEQILPYKNKFEQYILQILGNGEATLWDLPRMKELKAMLDFNNTNLKNWDEKTGYMDVKKFQERRVLPEPIDVIGDNV